MHRFDVKRSKMLRYVAKHSKNAKLRKWSTYTELHRFDVKTSKNVELRRKPFKTAKLQKWSTYTELHRFDVKTSKNDELHHKTFKTTQNYESDQIIMNCIDLTSKRSKWWVTSQNIQNYAKLRKWSNYNELHRFDVKRSKMLSYVANHSKPLNYKSDQLILNCIDLTSKRAKMLSYVANHSKPLNYSDQLILNCIDLTSKRAKMFCYSQNILDR